VFAAAAFVGLVLGAGALYQFLGTRRSARAFTPPGAFVDVAGQRLHAVSAGRGKPAVLFESGLAASSVSWTRVMREVATFTRACAYDRAGFGWSERPAQLRTPARMLDELHGVLRAAAAEPPYILVGHSFGAFLVCAYASQHPEDIVGLVLLDPPSEWHEITRERARLLRRGIRLSRVGAVLARLGVVRASLAQLTGGAPGVPRTTVRILGPTVLRTLEHLVGEVRKLPPDVHPIVEAFWCQPKCFNAISAHLAALEETAAAVAGMTSLSDIPLVIISGGSQRPETIARHRDLARLSTRGRHVVAAKSGHWVQFDEPDLIVATVREMVDRWRV